MENFAKLSLEERKPYFEEASARRGLPPQVMEKDFWLCWTLRQLFVVSPFAPHLTFKGGTSLSKVFNIIERFSEDIDLILDRAYLGFGGDNDPEVFASKGKRKDKVENLRQACGKKVFEELMPWFFDLLKSKFPLPEQWKLELVDDDRNTKSLMFFYPSCWPKEPAGYVARAVKMQIGGRSDFWPYEVHEITPFAAEEFPKAFEISKCTLRVLSPMRTFLEKVALVHEETYRPPNKSIKGGMSRHYYDLSRLILSGIAHKAMEDPTLFERVVEHRKVYFPYSWVDYSTMTRGNLRLIPPAERMDEWMGDYENMREMFFKDPPAFEEILAVVKQCEETFNAK